jgi:dihydroorotase-like cyclic amidohydrolase
MNIILKSAKVINVESKHNGSKQDILISEGKIKKIGSSISVKNAKQLVISKTFMFLQDGLTVVFHLVNRVMRKEKLF